MADQAKGSNGFGMSDEEIKRIVEREKKWKVKALRNKIKDKLLKAKIQAAGITVSEQEIDAAIAEQGK